MIRTLRTLVTGHVGVNPARMHIIYNDVISRVRFHHPLLDSGKCTPANLGNFVGGIWPSIISMIASFRCLHKILHQSIKCLQTKIWPCQGFSKLFGFDLIPTLCSNVSKISARTGHIDNSGTWFQNRKKNLTGYFIGPIVGFQSHLGLMSKWISGIIFKGYSCIVYKNIDPTILFLHKITKFYHSLLVANVKNVKLRVETFFSEGFNSILTSSFIS